MYRVRTSPDADKQLARLDGSIRVRIAQKIDALAENPRPPGCKKLKGDHNLWRVRAGDYRIVFSIHEDVLLVVVIRIAHRRDVYR
ncbi:MAG TPA: type II toxin-antitoxin system RelE/ParE family toxin [Polyangia bacterium]|jgi:mRNA interferase RelE/StbE